MSMRVGSIVTISVHVIYIFIVLSWKVTMSVGIVRKKAMNALDLT